MGEQFTKEDAVREELQEFVTSGMVMLDYQDDLTLTQVTSSRIKGVNIGMGDGYEVTFSNQAGLEGIIAIKTVSQPTLAKMMCATQAEAVGIFNNIKTKKAWINPFTTLRLSNDTRIVSDGIEVKIYDDGSPEDEMPIEDFQKLLDAINTLERYAGEGRSFEFKIGCKTFDRDDVVLMNEFVESFK